MLTSPNVLQEILKKPSANTEDEDDGRLNRMKEYHFKRMVAGGFAPDWLTKAIETAPAASRRNFVNGMHVQLN